MAVGPGAIALTTTSIPPKASSVRANAASTALPSPTSARMAIACPFPLVMSLTTWPAAALALAYTIAMAQPSAARRTAVLAADAARAAGDQGDARAARLALRHRSGMTGGPGTSADSMIPSSATSSRTMSPGWSQG